MKYLQGTALFLAIVGALYSTRAVWEDAEFQQGVKAYASEQASYYSRRAQQLKSAKGN